jgi:excisionase family DNA binding protein
VGGAKLGMSQESECKTEVFTVEDIHKYLKVSKVTVRQLIRDRKIKGFKAGREWRVNRSDLMEYTRSKR